MTITDHEDLLTEILLRLPTKSLIRFKLVCKRWFFIISTHHFSHTHTPHHHLRCQSNPDPSLLLRSSQTSSNYFYLKLHNQKLLLPYHFSPPLTQPKISSFSNGLFLLHCDAKIPIKDCCIYNPTTKQYRNISLNVNERYSWVMGLNLAFDPLQSPHYKIVCVRAARRRTSGFLGNCWDRCQIEVYESNTSTWKLSGEPFSSPLGVEFDHGIYWRGGIHWDGFFFDIDEGCVRGHPKVVLSGDTARDNLCYSNVESGGSLHFITHFLREKTVTVFELQSDFSQWLLKYTVDLDGYSGPVSVLSLVRGKSEEDDDVLVLHEPGKIVAYNFRDGSVEGLVDFGDEAFFDGSIQFDARHTFQFVETLAPPT